MARRKEVEEKAAGKLKRCSSCEAPEHPAHLAHVFGQAAVLLWQRAGRPAPRKSRSL